jgi:hypothetical protein
VPEHHPRRRRFDPHYPRRISNRLNRFIERESHQEIPLALGPCQVRDPARGDPILVALHLCHGAVERRLEQIDRRPMVRPQGGILTADELPSLLVWWGLSRGKPTEADTALEPTEHAPFVEAGKAFGIQLENGPAGAWSR